MTKHFKNTPREKCPSTEFFLVPIFLYSVRIQENTGQKKTPYLDDFSRSDKYVWNDQRENSGVFRSKGDPWDLNSNTSLSMWILFDFCLIKL